MTPKQLSKEIELAVMKHGKNGDYFTFKPLTVLYPDLRKRLANAETWAKITKSFTFNNYMKHECETRKHVKFVLNEFKLNQNFEKKDIKKKFKTVPYEFDKIYDFIE